MQPSLALNRFLTLIWTAGMPRTYFVQRVTMSVIGPSQQVTVSVIGRIVPSALQNSTLPLTWKKPSWNQLVVKGWTMLYKRFPRGESSKHYPHTLFIIWSKWLVGCTTSSKKRMWHKIIASGQYTTLSHTCVLHKHEI